MTERAPDPEDAAPSSADALRATALAQPLVGESLIQLCIGAGDAQLNFTGGFTIAADSAVVGAPAQDERVVLYALDGVAALLPLLNTDVTGVGISDDGALSVTVGGTTLRCSADAAFEAWNVTGPGGRLVVCMPGGSLAIWSAR